LDVDGSQVHLNFSAPAHVGSVVFVYVSRLNGSFYCSTLATSR
jgi:hypothetical protein